MAQLSLLDALIQLNQPQQNPYGAFMQQPMQPQSGWGQVMQGLQGLAAQDNRPLEHLNKLASAAPQYYASAYGQALGNVADPDRQINNAYKQSLIAAQNDPFERLARIQQLSINQQNADSALMKMQREQQGLEHNRELLSGGTPTMTGGGGMVPPRPIDNLAPLSVRNLNPGNLRDPATGEFRQFASAEEGLAAMRADLQAKVSGDSPAMKAKYGADYKPTLSNLLNVYAPPSENDTGSYINTVAKEAGLDPNQPLTIDDIDKIIPPMVKVEGGAPAVQAFTQPQTNAMTFPNGTGETPVVPVNSQLQDFAPQEQALDALKQLAISNPTAENTANYFKEQANLANKKVEAAQMVQENEGRTKKELTEAEGSLRKEFEGLPDVKQFREVEGSYRRIEKAVEQPSAAGDLALIFNYMKMLDPSSTVREGEFANAQNAAGVPDRIRNMFNKIKSGERLNPVQRTDFLTQAYGQYKGAEELFNERAQQYEGVASQYGFDPKRIIQGPRGGKNAPKTGKVVRFEDLP